MLLIRWFVVLLLVVLVLLFVWFCWIVEFLGVLALTALTVLSLLISLFLVSGLYGSFCFIGVDDLMDLLVWLVLALCWLY